MLTVGFVTVIVVFLVVIGVFAFLAKDNKRRRMSGEPGAGSGAKQERAPGLD
jgi:hypothetical protein